MDWHTEVEEEISPEEDLVETKDTQKEEVSEEVKEEEPLEEDKEFEGADTVEEIPKGKEKEYGF